MYTNSDIEIIVKNCINLVELYAVTASLSFLIEKGLLVKSSFIAQITLMRFIELENLEIN